jgi:hypothetical protein
MIIALRRDGIVVSFGPDQRTYQMALSFERRKMMRTITAFVCMESLLKQFPRVPRPPG